jgi:hypothetical protein
MRRLRWALTAAGLAVLITAGAFALWPRPDRVTLENLRRIHVGMTRGEVEGILGGPPGDYTTGPVSVVHIGGAMTAFSKDEWFGDHCDINIWFSDDKVINRHEYPVHRTLQPRLENLLWHAKRQWHRWFP